MEGPNARDKDIQEVRETENAHRRRCPTRAQDRLTPSLRHDEMHKNKLHEREAMTAKQLRRREWNMAMKARVRVPVKEEEMRYKNDQQIRETSVCQWHRGHRLGFVSQRSKGAAFPMKEPENKMIKGVECPMNDPDDKRK